jgi:hypothetical protein
MSLPQNPGQQWTKVGIHRPDNSMAETWIPTFVGMTG